LSQQVFGQDETPTPFLFSLKNLRNAAKKNVVRTVSPKPTALLPMFAAI
jgi:hypothetical protein